MPKAKVSLFYAPQPRIRVVSRRHQRTRANFLRMPPSPSVVLASQLLTIFAVTRHIQEIELIRGKVYSLEQQHNQMKAK
jgi:hypothetical protein